MKNSIEKKLKEIEKQFMIGRQEIAKIDSKRKETMDGFTRLQGAYAILREQLDEIEAKKPKKGK
ncbi:hypothetical protein KAU11_07240 [Candidatus Babeliales bacterium]|nr:hypothetical protein [Candidatus Babeliales bacterium]